jgi:glycosyltransferase involved in cell wall biosynthesis
MKKKLLVVGSLPPPYHGVSVIIKSLLESPLTDSFDIMFLDISDHRSLENVNKFDVINVVLAMKHSLLFIISLITHIPDIVYLSNSETFWGFLRDCGFFLPALFLNKKVVVHSHGSHFKDFYDVEAPIWLKAIIRWIFRRVERVIVVCSRLKFNYTWLLPGNRIFVVEYGIKDLGNPVKKPRKETKRQVLYLGNLIREKGFIDVIRCIPLVLYKISNIKFIFAGDWYEPADKLEVEEFIRNNELHDYVAFVGVVYGEEKENLLKGSDVLVFPTYYVMESFGVVIIEAMAAGLPVVTTAKACIPEIVIDGETGFIVEPKNPEQIAEKLTLLCENENLRARMGLAARQRFLSYYTFEKFIRNLEKALEGID